MTIATATTWEIEQAAHKDRVHRYMEQIDSVSAQPLTEVTAWELLVKMAQDAYWVLSTVERIGGEWELHCCNLRTGELFIVQTARHWETYRWLRNMPLEGDFLDG